MVIVISDGISTVFERKLDLIEEANALKQIDQSNTEVYSVSITDFVNYNELETICSIPTNQYLFQLTPNSTQQNIEDVADQLIQRMCN